MSASTRSARRRRPALAVAALVTALAVTATACGPEDDGAGGGSKPSKPAGDQDEKRDLGIPEDLRKDLPKSLEDLDKWRGGEWKNWDRDEWLRRAKEFVNPIIDDLWDRTG